MRKSKYFITFVWFIISFINVIHAQYTTTTYNIEDGLSSYKVQSIFKDKHGYLWIGTENGLNRFDGSEFKTFRHLPEDPESLSDGNILSITQDKEGLLWIGIDGGGVNILNPFTHKITRYFDSIEYQKRHLQYVKHIFIDNNNIAWISTWGGLIRFDIVSKKYKVYFYNSGENSIASSDVKSVVMDHYNNLWIATSNGLSLFDPVKEIFINYYKGSKSIPLPDNSVRYLYIDSKNLLWIGTSESLMSYDIELKKHQQFIIDKNNYRSSIINEILEGKAGQLWICTEGGVYLSNEKPSLNKDLNFIQVSHHIETNSIIEGENNQIWYGTRNHGLSVLSAPTNKFQTLFYPGSKEINKQCRSIIKGHDNSIWFGSFQNGIINYNLTTKKYYQYLKNTPVKDSKIETLLLDKNTIWIGTYLDGVYNYNFDTKQLRQHKINKVITCLYQHDDNTTWVGTGQGIHFFDLNQNEVSNSYNFLPELLFSSHIYFIKKDSKNNIWISTMNDGVFKINHTGTFDRYGNNEGYNYVCFYEDVKNNYYYLGSRNGGLMKISSNGSISKLSTKNGLSSNTISGITKAADNLWVSTALGINRIPLGKNKRIQNYDKHNGVDSYEFYRESLVNFDGNIFFGGTEGITALRPEDFVQEKNKQTTIITELNIANKPILLDTIIDFTKKISLNYNENIISIGFSSIGFNQSNKFEYQYQLEGVDEKWVDAGNKKTVTYTNLKPGQYNFRVNSTNNEGVWSQYPASLQIEIQPPFWQTWWFYSLLGITFFGSIVFIVIKREEKLIIEKENAQFKLKALRSQMNPHFIFNSLNSIQYFIVQNENRFALNYLSKFSKLVRKILENSTQDRIQLSEEIAFLKNYIEIESLRFDKEILFEINVDDELLEDEIEIPSMLIQPYAENAIIHGLMNIPKSDKRDRRISITFTRENQLLQCIIIDNGIGREASQKINEKIKKNHKSLGLSITKSRLDTINKTNSSSITVKTEDLLIESRVEGTKISIFIPLD